MADRGPGGGYLVLCKTDPKEEEVSKAFSLVWIEGNQKGLSYTDAGQKFSHNMTKTDELNLDTVQVPDSNLVGEKGSFRLNNFLMRSKL